MTSQVQPMNTKRVIIVRGVPGSGKSTWIREQLRHLPVGSYAWCSNDHYFETETGEYNWSAEKMGDAIAATKAKVEAAYADPTVTTIFIDNVHARLQHMLSFLDGIPDDVIEVVEFIPQDIEFHVSRNVHRVPREHLQRMLDTWERYDFRRHEGWKFTKLQPQF